MPPSGFSTHAVKGVRQFLETCSDDLLNEVSTGKHKDFESGLRFELEQIKKALNQPPASPAKTLSKQISKGSLILTRGYYADILRAFPVGKGGDPKKAIQSALDKAENTLNELHIDRKGRLMKRKAK